MGRIQLIVGIAVFLVISGVTMHYVHLIKENGRLEDALTSCTTRTVAMEEQKKKDDAAWQKQVDDCKKIPKWRKTTTTTTCTQITPEGTKSGMALYETIMGFDTPPAK